MKNSLILALLSIVPAFLSAEEAQKVSIEGTGMCAKCSLGEAKKCTNVIEVASESGKATRYYFTKNMKHGEFFCSSKTEGLVVTGTVSEAAGKMMIDPVSVELKAEDKS